MANNFVSLIPNKHIAVIYYQLKKVTLSIGFLNKYVYYNFITFAKVFATIRDKQQVNKKVMIDN